MATANKIVKNGNKYITVADASRILKKHYATVRVWVHDEGLRTLHELKYRATPKGKK